MAQTFMESLVNLFDQLPKNAPRPAPRNNEAPEIRQATPFGSIPNMIEAMGQMGHRPAVDRPVVYKDLKPESERKSTATTTIGKAIEADQAFFKKLAKELGLK